MIAAVIPPVMVATMTRKTYNSAYDDMHERPETLGEAITFMIDGFRLVHKNARILAKENTELRTLVNTVITKQKIRDKREEKRQAKVAKFAKNFQRAGAEICQ